MAACRSCRAPITWAKTADGRPIPLEACSPDEGNILIDDKGFAMVTAAGKGHWRPHFASCPDAPAWRKKNLPSTN